MFPRPVLYTDLDGYAIKPHPDTRRKVLTMQIYLPADDTQRDLGTTIYKISPMGVFAWKSYGLVKEKTVPFLPNTGYAFAVGQDTYHSVDVVGPEVNTRDSILLTYFVDQTFVQKTQNRWKRFANSMRASAQAIGRMREAG